MTQWYHGVGVNGKKVYQRCSDKECRRISPDLHYKRSVGVPIFRHGKFTH